MILELLLSASISFNQLSEDIKQFDYCLWQTMEIQHLVNVDQKYRKRVWLRFKRNHLFLKDIKRLEKIITPYL